jgi:hypothetical protein
MSALQSNRNTSLLDNGAEFLDFPVEANTTIYLGSMVALNGNGNAVLAQSIGGAPLDRLRVVGALNILWTEIGLRFKVQKSWRGGGQKVYESGARRCSSVDRGPGPRILPTEGA